MNLGIDKYGIVHITDNLISLNKIPIDSNGMTLAHVLFRNDYEHTLTSFNLERVYDSMLKYIDKNYNFYISDSIECVPLDSNTNLDIFWDWAKKNKIENRITIWTNWLDYNSNKFKIKGYPLFLSKSHHINNKHIKIENRTLHKHFLFLNYVPRLHRRKMFDFMKSRNLLEKSYYSFGTDYELDWNWIDFKLYPTKRLDGEIDINKMHALIPEYFNSFCSIVSESYCFQKDEIIMPWMNEEGIPILKAPTFITEKTDKPISSAQPFIVVSTPFFLKKLKELGYKTFDRWWDESYDEIEDDSKRIIEIQKVILEISTWSLEKCFQTLIDMKEILIHNMNHNEKIGDSGWRSIEGYHNSPINLI